MILSSKEIFPNAKLFPTKWCCFHVCFSIVLGSPEMEPTGMESQEVLLQAVCKLQSEGGHRQAQVRSISLKIQGAAAVSVWEPLLRPGICCSKFQSSNTGQPGALISKAHSRMSQSWKGVMRGMEGERKKKLTFSLPFYPVFWVVGWWGWLPLLVYWFQG